MTKSVESNRPGGATPAEWPHSSALAEALAAEGVAYPSRWAQLVEVIVRRFEGDAEYAAGTFAREWYLVSAFDEFVSSLSEYEGPDRAERIEAAFDEHLAPFHIDKPF